MTYLTDADLAERLQIDEATVARWRQRFGWPHLKFGRQVRYTEEDVKTIEGWHRVTPEAPREPPPLPGQTPRSAALNRDRFTR